MIRHEFESPVDGMTLFRNIWLPPETPRAMIVFAHGMLEHSGRHADWGRRFASDRAIGVAAPDARGHGKSDGRRAWVEDFDHFVDDYRQTVRDVAGEYPETPLFMMGFSMGGAIATLTAMEPARIPTQVAGLILIAPAVRFQGKMFPALHLAASVLDHVVPKIRIAKPNFNILSRNKNLVEEFRNDPLVHHGQLLLHFSTEILKAMNRIQHQADRLRLPLLVMQGSSDWVVTPSGATDLIEKASSRDKTLQFYEGLYHELLHEPEQDQVLGDLLDWVGARS